MQITHKCAGCNESFRKDEMLQYSTFSGKTTYWYCKKCYEEKLERENFSNRICMIFGIKSPGPVIWTQRKRLKDTYGYTDDTILDCLTYVYNIRKIKKISESLYFVKPEMVEEMRKWKANKEQEAKNIAAAMINMNTTEYVFPVDEKKQERVKTNLEDGLFDD